MPHARRHVERSIRIRRSTSLRNRRALKKADCTLRCKRHIRPTSVPAKKRCSTRSHRIRRFQAAQADPVQLAREQLFTNAFIAELQYQRLQKSKHIEVLLGQILALLTRTMEQPKIEAQRLQLRSRDAP